VHDNILLFKGNKNDGKEMDIEGIEVNNDFIYVIGSHSAKRKKVKDDKPHEENLAKFKDPNIKYEVSRDRLYRLTVDTKGKLQKKEKISLRNHIEKDERLRIFGTIPSKENGIDIEGISVGPEEGTLFLGFRGPKFRGNYVPIMRLKFEDPQNNHKLLFVNLKGRGIRDMTYVPAGFLEGFLIIAGPVGDETSSYQLYHWDGKDAVPGTDRNESVGKVHLLGEIPIPPNGKAEGLAVIQYETDQFYKLIITYDGVKNTNQIMQYFRINKS
jgi:hypothetical protein